MDILFVTGNPHKVAALQALLGRPLQQVDLDLPEIQAVDVRDVIEQKARAAYALVDKPVLVEDTGLAVAAWHGLPGALVRWFLESVGNAGICRMLADFESRSAQAQTCLGYFDGEHFLAFCGVVAGQIAPSPRGARGFGWDPIFVPDGWDKTLAEMTPADQRDFVSMRTSAVLKFKDYLDKADADPAARDALVVVG